MPARQLVDNYVRSVLDWGIARAETGEVPTRIEPRFEQTANGFRLHQDEHIHWGEIARAAIHTERRFEDSPVANLRRSIVQDLEPSWIAGTDGGTPAILSQEVLVELIESVMKDHQDLEIPENDLRPRIDRAHAELEEFLYAETFRITLVAPITGAVPTDDHLNIVDGVSVELATDADRQAIWRVYGSRPGRPGMLTLDVNWVANVTAMVKVTAEFPRDVSDFNQMHSQVPNLIDAIRLTTDGTVFSLGRYIDYPVFGGYLRRFKSTQLMRSGLDSHYTDPIDGPMASAEVIAEVLQLLSNYREALAPRERETFDLARRRLGFAYGRSFAADALVDCWVAFEALFTPDGNDGEVAHKTASRIAFAVSTDPEERLDDFRKLKKLYNARSKVAHGSSVDGIDDKVTESLSYLRRAMIAWLRPDAARSVDELNAVMFGGLVVR